MTLDVLRRIAERGLSYAQRFAEPPPYPEYEAGYDMRERKRWSHVVDLFQHMLDELKRCEQGEENVC